MNAAFKQNNIDTSKIKFIDTISAIAVPDLKNTECCTYVAHPSNLTEISIQIPESLKKIKGKKILILDSISTLLVYNKVETIVRFLHSISTVLSSMETDVVFIALEGEGSKELENISTQFCDKVIRV